MCLSLKMWLGDTKKKTQNCHSYCALVFNQALGRFQCQALCELGIEILVLIVTEEKNHYFELYIQYNTYLIDRSP